MFGSSIIEVAIGLVFVYLLMSLICSAASEIIEARLKNRATDLERGIRELFNHEGGGGLVEKFYTHPLISGLFSGAYRRQNSKGIRWSDFLKKTNLPSYIPTRNFSNAVLDLVLHPPAAARVGREDAAFAAQQATPANAAAPARPAVPASMASIREAIATNFGDTQVGRALRTLAEQSGEDLNAMRENVEAWFDSAMDRVSGVYKRRTKWIIFALGFVLTVLLNVNTITIARSLSASTTLRSVVVAQAGAFAQRENAATPNLEENRKTLESLGLPLGWPDGLDVYPFKNPALKFNWWDHFILHLIGWLLTAAAISLGAPFWFDLLNKFMVVRATVKPHEKSPEEGSEDRQDRASNRIAAALAKTLEARPPGGSATPGGGK